MNQVFKTLHELVAMTCETIWKLLCSTISSNNQSMWHCGMLPRNALFLANQEAVLVRVSELNCVQMGHTQTQHIKSWEAGKHLEFMMSTEKPKSTPLKPCFRKVFSAHLECVYNERKATVTYTEMAESSCMMCKRICLNGRFVLCLHILHAVNVRYAYKFCHCRHFKCSSVCCFRISLIWFRSNLVLFPRMQIYFTILLLNSFVSRFASKCALLSSFTTH